MLCCVFSSSEYQIFLTKTLSENRIFKIQGNRTWISLQLTSSINEHDDFLIYITQITKFGGKHFKKGLFSMFLFLVFLKISSTLGWAWSIQESINGRINVSIRRH